MGLGAFRIDALQGGDNESSGLSGTVFGPCQYVSSREGNGYRLFLNRRGLFKSSLKDPHHELALDIEIFKFEAFCGGDILFPPVSLMFTP